MEATALLSLEKSTFTFFDVSAYQLANSKLGAAIKSERGQYYTLERIRVRLHLN